MSSSRRLQYTLGAIGLLIVGLLSGILLMLVVQPTPQDETSTPRRVVDRVDLADRSARTAPVTDSGGRTALADPTVPEPATLNRLFRNVADRVTPAVVFIQVAASSDGDGYREYRGDMRDFFRNPVPQQSVGSGVLISRDGYIVTNNHVVESAGTIRVTLDDKREFDAEIVGTDASTDLAVIKISHDAPLPALDLGDSDSVEVGDWVVAVGNPFRLTSTVTAGIVSALGRQVNIIEDSFRIEDFIQTDAAINPGNSGGALVNMRGELVGINTAIATESGSYEGYGFAVPTNLMERVVRDLIAYGEVRRGFLGVSIQEIDSEAAKMLGLDAIEGVRIGQVRDGGAASQAGIEPGDVVLSIEGYPINAPNELQSIVARHRPGDALRVHLWRNGTERDVRVTLMGRDAPAYQGWRSELNRQNRPAPPEPEATPPSDPPTLDIGTWGIGVRPMTATEQALFQQGEGVYVAFVEQGGAADAAGLPRDVVITRVDDTAVATPTDLQEAVADAAEPVLVEVQRRDATRAYYEVR